jgi:hypothetical protein
MTLTARVLSTTRVSIFTGDTEEVAYAYALQPEGGEKAIVVIGRDARCPAVGDVVARYRLGLERRRTPIGLHGSQSATLATDLIVVACDRLDVR